MAPLSHQSFSGPSCAEVKEFAQQRISELVAELVPGAIFRQGKYWALNPTRADKNVGSFYIDASGSWRDHATGDAGDILDLVAYTKRISKNDARKWLSARLGMESTFPVNVESQRGFSKAEKCDKLERNIDLSKLMYAALPPEGTPVEVYLTSRGLSLCG